MNDLLSNLERHMQRVENERSTILYKKVGETFVPVTDPWATTGLGEGWWLVQVRPGSTTIRVCVYPNHAEIQAAALEKADQLIEIIRKASEAQPLLHEPMTPEFRKDWDALLAKHGHRLNTLQYPSFAQNAEDIINVITKFK